MRRLAGNSPLSAIVGRPVLATEAATFTVKGLTYRELPERCGASHESYVWHLYAGKGQFIAW
jgi:hypothetical protein